MSSFCIRVSFIMGASLLMVDRLTYFSFHEPFLAAGLSMGAAGGGRPAKIRL